ncbi:LysM peptidoglycan-binding domain-containing protein [Candidatus Formimonas warabiya]|uniref:LysM domain-containing protein n=1 Tax=Formimonas warabiya TaxID=1761012 RepID=A0A3G1KP56_FORW1|nr:LysM peptidoglycan-binding domain-containing protein [Candidatus Formimonas warabiya]ATW24253.1 hypothetical protein DCMF_05150 [Candidatus Formimonas warabiya]
MRIKHKKYRLNLNKLLTAGLFLFVCAGCLSLGLKVAAANFYSASGKTAYIEVIVKSGDSLWDLTEKHYTGKDDIRRIIYEVKKMNDLPSANLVPGQIIKLPQY